MLKRIKKITGLVATVLILNLYTLPVQAGALTSLKDDMSRLAQNTASNHSFSFTLAAPTTIIQNETITVTFPAAFSATLDGIDCGDIDILDDGVQETMATTGGGCTAGASAWGASVATRVLTLTAPSTSATYLDGSSVVNIRIGTNATEGATGNTQIVNPATAVYTIEIGGTFGDTGKIAVAIIDNDQIPVTASVNPSISLTVANTTLNLGVLDSGSIATSSENNIVIGTNAGNGYTITVKDDGNLSNPGLYNTGASKLIASSTGTLSIGAEGYGANCNKTSGDGTCSFADGATQNVTGLTLAGTTFASHGAKPNGNTTYRIRVKASISSSTDAGAYSDTLTVMGTANF